MAETRETSTDNTQDLRSIAIAIDDSADSLLSTPTGNTEEELSIPREEIITAVRGSRFQAELERPIRIGTINAQPAFLLCFHFSFQRTTRSWFSRVQQATIEIEFLNASGTSGGENPSVAKFHPGKFEGPVTRGTVTYHTDATASLPSIPGGPTLSANISRDMTLPRESQIIVHGLARGRPARNRISWAILEDEILKTGMPGKMQMPVIVTMKQMQRFSAKVTVKAHYSFIKGVITKMVPVIGKMDDPLYFDPSVLDEKATSEERGLDSRRIAERVGELKDVRLGDYSTFPLP